MSDQAVAYAETDIIEKASKRTHRQLKKAVHQHKPISRAGILERIFTVLFTGLVYPQIWEDPEIDLEALELKSDSRIVTIASGGCNVLSYLTAGPAHITAVDLNRAHIALTRLKVAAADRLPIYDHFFRFFGSADHKSNISAYGFFLSDHLDAETKAYWEGRLPSGRKRISLFSRGFYRFGVLGHFIGWTHKIARLYGVDFRQLLAANSLEEQRTYFTEKLAPIFDRKLIRWVTSKPASLYGLGIPPSQYVALAAGRPMHDVLRDRLERLVCAFPISNNYFAWQAFGRRYAPVPNPSLPPYLKRENFSMLQAHADRVEVLHQSFTEVLRRKGSVSVDRYVLLDAQDWMTDEQLNELWAEITRTATPGARVIFRTAAKPSLLPGRVAADTLARWSYHDAASLDWTERDRSSIYGGFHLYTFNG